MQMLWYVLCNSLPGIFSQHFLLSFPGCLFLKAKLYVFSSFLSLEDCLSSKVFKLKCPSFFLLRKNFFYTFVLSLKIPSSFCEAKAWPGFLNYFLSAPPLSCAWTERWTLADIRISWLVPAPTSQSQGGDLIFSQLIYLLETKQVGRRGFLRAYLECPFWAAQEKK